MESKSLVRSLNHLLREYGLEQFKVGILRLKSGQHVIEVSKTIPITVVGYSEIIQEFCEAIEGDIKFAPFTKKLNEEAYQAGYKGGLQDAAAGIVEIVKRLSNDDA